MQCVILRISRYPSVWSDQSSARLLGRGSLREARELVHQQDFLLWRPPAPRQDDDSRDGLRHRIQWELRLPSARGGVWRSQCDWYEGRLYSHRDLHHSYRVPHSLDSHRQSGSFHPVIFISPIWHWICSADQIHPAGPSADILHVRLSAGSCQVPLSASLVFLLPGVVAVHDPHWSLPRLHLFCQVCRTLRHHLRGTEHSTGTLDNSGSNLKEELWCSPTLGGSSRLPHHQPHLYLHWLLLHSLPYPQ